MRLALFALFAFMLGSQPAAWASEWTTYGGPGFVIEVPADYVEAADSKPDHLVLVDGTNTVLLEVYGGPNKSELSAAELADSLSRAERIADVTYRAEGRSWFVLSGHYRSLGSGARPLIYYAKLLISADGSRLAGFEISYPQDDKRRLDPVVSRIEDSFRRQ